MKRDRDWHDASINQGTPKLPEDGRGRVSSSLETTEGVHSFCHLSFRLLASGINFYGFKLSRL